MFSKRVLFAVVLFVNAIIVTWRNPFWGIVFMGIVMFPGVVLNEVLFGLNSILHMPRVLGIVTFISFLRHKKEFNPEGIVWSRQLDFMVIMLVLMIVSRLSAGGGIGLTYGIIDTFIKTIFYYFFIINMVNTRQRLKIVVWLLLLVFFYMCYRGWILYKTGELETMRPSLSYDKNHFGMDIVMMLPIAISFMWMQAKIWKKGVVAIIALMYVLAIARSFSRGAVLGGGVVLIFYCAYNFKHFTRILLLIIVVPMLYSFLTAKTPQKFVDRLKTLVSANDPDYEKNRKDSWTTGLRMFSANPVLGVGPGMFLERYAEYSPSVEEGWFDHTRQAHNLYVQLLAECGFVVFILAMSCIFISLKDIIVIRKMLRYVSNPLEIDDLVVSFGLAITGYMMCGYFLNTSSHLLLIYTIFALVFAVKNIIAKEIATGESI